MLPVRRDPAPSRVKYRLQRLWLTPLVRRLVRTGLPLAMVIALLVAVAMNPRVQATVTDWSVTVRDTLAAHPDLMVGELEISGASPDLAVQIESTLALDLPSSALDLDLDDMRDAIAALEPVADVEARFGTDGTLKIDVAERVPVAIWKGSEGFTMVDATGARTGALAHRSVRADLPLLAGDEAMAHVPEALRILSIAAPVAARVRGLVRVGDRRWNLVLAPDLTVKLPEAAPARALRRLMALQKAKSLLDRDLVAVDLRDPDRPVVRLSPAGLARFIAKKSPDPDDDV